MFTTRSSPGASWSASLADASASVASVGAAAEVDVSSSSPQAPTKSALAQTAARPAMAAADLRGRGVRVALIVVMTAPRLIPPKLRATAAPDYGAHPAITSGQTLICGERVGGKT